MATRLVAVHHWDQICVPTQRPESNSRPPYASFACTSAVRCRSWCAGASSTFAICGLCSTVLPSTGQGVAPTSRSAYARRSTGVNPMVGSKSERVATYCGIWRPGDWWPCHQYWCAAVRPGAGPLHSTVRQWPTWTSHRLSSQRRGDSDLRWRKATVPSCCGITSLTSTTTLATPRRWADVSSMWCGLTTVCWAPSRSRLPHGVSRRAMRYWANSASLAVTCTTGSSITVDFSSSHTFGSTIWHRACWRSPASRSSGTGPHTMELNPFSQRPSFSPPDSMASVIEPRTG
jgi:hypothetical protein